MRRKKIITITIIKVDVTAHPDFRKNIKYHRNDIVKHIFVRYFFKRLLQRFYNILCYRHHITHKALFFMTIPMIMIVRMMYNISI